MRTPAAFCGVVGLKTTKGMLSTEGIAPLSHTLDTPGPIARSVADAAFACASMVGGGPGADFEARARAALDAGVGGLRLAVMGDSGRRLVRDPAQLEAFDAAVALLRGLGADVSVFDFDVNEGFVNAGTFVYSAAEGFFNNRAFVEDDPLRTKMDARVRASFLGGRDVPAHEYIEVDRARGTSLRRFLDGLGDRRAWLTPTTACLAIEQAGIDESGDRFKPGPFTGPVNFMGLCAVAVPARIVRGLPASLQIVCRPDDEATAIRIARAFERGRGPLPPPPLLL